MSRLSLPWALQLLEHSSSYLSLGVSSFPLERAQALTGMAALPPARAKRQRLA